jgi:D-sedoheptulose 7-phosphate isomerase
MIELRVEQNFIDSADLKYQAAQTLSKPIAQAVQAILVSLTSGGKILSCDDGMSIGAAKYFSAQLVGQFERSRPELAALALSTEAIGLGEEGGEQSFVRALARQVRALGSSGDVLVAITSTGNSERVMAAIDAAHEREMVVIGLSGQSGGALKQLLRDTDIHIPVPSDRAVRVQEVNLLTLHCICDLVDIQLLGELEV